MCVCVCVRVCIIIFYIIAYKNCKETVLKYIKNIDIRKREDIDDRKYKIDDKSKIIIHLPPVKTMKIKTSWNPDKSHVKC